MSIVAVVAFQLIVIMPGIHAEISNGFSVVFQTTPRLLLGCFCSYFLGSYVNAYVMSLLKEKFFKYLFVRCIASTFFGELVDSIIFLTISFAGAESVSVLITMMICQVTFKVVYEIVAYPLTKYAINWMRSLENRPLKY